MVIAGHETQKGQPFGGGGGQILAYCLDGLDVLGFQSGRQRAGVVALQGQARAPSLAPGHGHPMAGRLRPRSRTAIAEATGQRPVDQDLKIGSRHDRRSDEKGEGGRLAAPSGRPKRAGLGCRYCAAGAEGLRVRACMWECSRDCLFGVSVGCLDGKTPRIQLADAPARGGTMTRIGIATSRSGVFLKLIEEIRCNLLIYKSINIYAQKLWITL